ncbi:MAG: restriction endonuclease [Actinomycetota bacterium]
MQLTQDEIFGLFGLQAPSTPGRASRPRPTGLELEDRCEKILLDAGWSVKRTPRTRDGGVDVIASRVDEVGVEHRLFVQCKDYARPVGVEIVRELLGVLPPGQSVRAVIAAPAGLTADAGRLADDRGVIVWDKSRLSEFESRTGD